MVQMGLINQNGELTKEFGGNANPEASSDSEQSTIS
jgi:hypothetical protein